jgi:hypothetical protein
MKTLLTITLLITSINLFGQGYNPYLDSISTMYKEAFEYEYYYENLKPIMDQYEEYKQVCYNDSIRVHYYFNINEYWMCHSSVFLGKDSLTCSNPLHFKIIHKQPTFIDFMEWLNNKYK